MRAGALETVRESGDPAAHEVVDGETHGSGLLEMVPDGGAGVKRIRVVLIERDAVRELANAAGPPVIRQAGDDELRPDGNDPLAHRIGVGAAHELHLPERLPDPGGRITRVGDALRGVVGREGRDRRDEVVPVRSGIDQPYIYGVGKVRKIVGRQVDVEERERARRRRIRTRIGDGYRQQRITGSGACRGLPDPHLQDPLGVPGEKTPLELIHEVGCDGDPLQARIPLRHHEPRGLSALAAAAEREERLRPAVVVGGGFDADAARAAFLPDGADRDGRRVAVGDSVDEREGHLLEVAGQRAKRAVRREAAHLHAPVGVGKDGADENGAPARLKLKIGHVPPRKVGHAARAERQVVDVRTPAVAAVEKPGGDDGKGLVDRIGITEIRIDLPIVDEIGRVEISYDPFERQSGRGEQRPVAVGSDERLAAASGMDESLERFRTEPLRHICRKEARPAVVIQPKVGFVVVPIQQPHVVRGRPRQIRGCVFGVAVGRLRPFGEPLVDERQLVSVVAEMDEVLVFVGGRRLGPLSPAGGAVAVHPRIRIDVEDVPAVPLRGARIQIAMPDEAGHKAVTRPISVADVDEQHVRRPVAVYVGRCAEEGFVVRHDAGFRRDRSLGRPAVQRVVKIRHFLRADVPFIDLSRLDPNPEAFAFRHERERQHVEVQVFGMFGRRDVVDLEGLGLADPVYGAGFRERRPVHREGFSRRPRGRMAVYDVGDVDFRRVDSSQGLGRSLAGGLDGHDRKHQGKGEQGRHGAAQWWWRGDAERALRPDLPDAGTPRAVCVSPLRTPPLAQPGGIHVLSVHLNFPIHPNQFLQPSYFGTNHPVENRPRESRGNVVRRPDRLRR